MNHFHGLALILALGVSAAAQTAAPELTIAGVPPKGAAKAVGAAFEAARPLFEVLDLDSTSGKRSFLLTIRAGQLDKPYLLSATISRGLGSGVHSGDPSDSFLFEFHRVEDAIQLVRLNTGFRADPGTPEAIGVHSDFPDTPLASVKIATENAKQGWVVVPIDGFFMSDPSDVEASVAVSFSIPKSGLGLMREQSRIEGAQALHSNMEIDALFVFEPQTPVFSETLPDGRYLPVAVRYSISVPPDAKGFDSRPLDPRVGYFGATYKDYSAKDLKDRLDPVRQLAERWRLEKSVPDAPISDVKKPVTWWIDAAAPERYRGAIKAGVLAWNEAFEAIGLRGALVVKEVDKDMSPEERAHFNPADASYNMVRWFLDPSAGYSFGPSRVDPRTGEIYNATVMIADQMSRLWDISFKPELAASIAEDVRPDPAMLAALQAQGISPAEKAKVTQDYITSVVMHEIGHTLGLRHNFKGSQLYGPADEGKDGLISSSIMDYLPMNVPAPGQPKVYFQTKIGPYDRWAVEYGYKPMPADSAEKARALNAIAKRADTDAKLAYGTDEDAQGIDPDVQRFDFSNDHLKYSESLVDRAESMWRKSAAGGAPGILPPPLVALRSGMTMYKYSVDTILPTIGGVRSTRRPVDEGGTILKPVSGAEQRAALDFLSRRVFAAGAFAVPPALALTAAPDPLESSAGTGVYNSAGTALSIQRSALEHLYDPKTQARVIANSRLEAGALKPSELFSRVHQAVWPELGAKGAVSVPAQRRQLQRAEVQELIRLAMNEDAPADSISLARADLSAIARDARRAAARASDAETRAHLIEMARLAGSIDGPEGVAAR